MSILSDDAIVWVQLPNPSRKEAFRGVACSPSPTGIVEDLIEKSVS